jgi:cytochrome c5
MLRLLKLVIACCVLGLSLQATPKQDLPAGAGADVVRAKCVLCHETDLITQQRLSRPGWVREVDKMIRWGTVVNETEKEAIINYLAANFGPKPAVATASSSAEDPGKKIFEEKCLLCHEADLTEQQRLSRAGWTREVDKMIRWGAVVNDAEKEAIVSYLASRYHP